MYQIRWEFGPHGDISGECETFEEAVKDALLGHGNWWRENLELNGPETFRDTWRDNLFEMKTDVYEEGKAEKLWPVTDADYAKIEKMGKEILIDAIVAKKRREQEEKNNG